ncbi:MAG TPA: hydroxyphenylacetyl-CoA thioesterase PaaI [Stenotrophomonas sp.]|nr:hydroxyphenylacetyl-CoA thioesterase PaaI [Stenotrophomonas sp.]
MSAEQLAAEVAAVMLAADQATRALGMQLESVQPGSASVRMQVRADMLNGHGTCHGGFIFALADSAFAFACNSDNQRTVAAGCQIDFLRPAGAGEWLRAVASARRIGARQGVFDVEIRDAQERLVALFRGRSSRIGGTLVQPRQAAPQPGAQHDA